MASCHNMVYSACVSQPPRPRDRRVSHPARLLGCRRRVRHSPPQTLVNTVKDAQRAYNVKHGIPSIDDQQFFDEDEDEDESVEPPSGDGDGADELSTAHADAADAGAERSLADEDLKAGAGEGEDIYS